MNGLPSLTITQILGIEDIICAIVLLWSALKITAHFGIKTPDNWWALGRRVLYLGTSMALIALGVERFDGSYPVDLGEFTAQSIVLLYVVLFPVLRAIGVITQDRFTAFQSEQTSGEH